MTHGRREFREFFSHTNDYIVYGFVRIYRAEKNNTTEQETIIIPISVIYNKPIALLLKQNISKLKRKKKEKYFSYHHARVSHDYTINISR